MQRSLVGQGRNLVQIEAGEVDRDKTLHSFIGSIKKIVFFFLNPMSNTRSLKGSEYVKGCV